MPGLSAAAVRGAWGGADRGARRHDRRDRDGVPIGDLRGGAGGRRASGAARGGHGGGRRRRRGVDGGSLRRRPRLAGPDAHGAPGAGRTWWAGRWRTRAASARSIGRRTSPSTAATSARRTPATPQHVTAANVAYGRDGGWRRDRGGTRGTLGEGGARPSRGAGQGASRSLRRPRSTRTSATGFGDFCRDRFAHGRDYAAERLTEEGAGRRWLYLAGAPLLPFVLTGRVARAAGRRRLGPFIRALPFTFLFLGAWSAGEAAGYLRGAPSARSRRAWLTARLRPT